MVGADLPRVDDLRAFAVDGIGMGDDLLGVDLPNLVASINFTGNATAYWTLRNHVSESMRFNDAVAVVWSLLLQENISLAGAAVGNRFLLGAIVDTVHALGLAATRLDALAAVSAAMTMEAMTASGWSAEAVDNIAFNDALQATVAMLAPIVDSASIAGDASNAVRIVAIAADGAHAADSLATAMQMQADAEDSILLYATLSLGDGEYSGWVLNTDSKGASQYTNFPFESLASAQRGRFAGRTFGAGDGGIFEVTGDTDDGEQIPAYIKTGLLDFGSSKLKRVPDVYFSQTGAGLVVLKVVSRDDAGDLVEDWYVQDPNPGSAPRTGHVAVGRGLKARVYGFTFHNQDGGALDLSGIELRRLILDRRK